MADAYVFQAALLCSDCAQAVMAQTPPPEGVDPANPDESLYDSGDWPKGPYADGGGEADSPQHCDHCQTFLENPLTGDGEEYVRCVFAEHVATGRGVVPVLTQWRDFYGYIWETFIDETYPRMREEGLTDEQRERFGDLCFD